MKLLRHLFAALLFSGCAFPPQVRGEFTVADNYQPLRYTATADQTVFTGITWPFEQACDLRVYVSTDAGVSWTAKTTPTCGSAGSVDYSTTGAGTSGGGTLTFEDDKCDGDAGCDVNTLVMILRDDGLDRTSDFTSITPTGVNLHLDRQTMQIQQVEDFTENRCIQVPYSNDYSGSGFSPVTPQVDSDDASKAVCVNATYDGFDFCAIGAADGDVTCPLNSGTENRITRWDETDCLLQDSGIRLEDDNALTNLTEMNGVPIDASGYDVWSQLGGNYTTGDNVREEPVGGAGYFGYEALATHTPSSSNRPGIGADWRDVWEQLDEPIEFNSPVGFNAGINMRRGVISSIKRTEFRPTDTSNAFRNSLSASDSLTENQDIELPIALPTHEEQVLTVTAVSGDDVTTYWADPMNGYRVSIVLAGKPTNSEFIPGHVFPVAVTCPDDFAGSRAIFNTAFAATVQYDVRSSGASIGQMDCLITSTTCTFTSDGGSDETFAAGTTLDLIAPATVDTAADDMRVTFECTEDL